MAGLDSITIWVHPFVTNFSVAMPIWTHFSLSMPPSSVLNTHLSFGCCLFYFPICFSFLTSFFWNFMSNFRPDHINLKSYHQFVAVTDMYLNVKNQLLTPNGFEILKFKNPAIWLAESIFVFNPTHQKYMINLQLLALKPFWVCLSRPDHTHLDLHNQFITLIHMKLF